MQVSYRYSDVEEDRLALQKIIDTYPDIENIQAFISFKDGYIGDFMFKKFEAYKPSLEQINNRISEGRTLFSRIINNNVFSHIFMQDNKHYKALYASQSSAIFDDAAIIYNIVFNETPFYEDQKNLKIIMLSVTLLGSIAVIALFLIGKKESWLENQDRFIKASMHEIHTPLSIITLNNELREIEYGSDDYGRQINTALKVLKNSYDDLNFAIVKDKADYKKENLDLAVVLRERVDYFTTIAQSQNRQFALEVGGKCNIYCSMIELTRLIDNNLSNAIKYSVENSTITTKLSVENGQGILIFHNMGPIIRHTNKIFTRYFRENAIKGGYGLGLSTVKSIADKYGIQYQVTSNKDDGTTFMYVFPCHTADISKR